MNETIIIVMVSAVLLGPLVIAAAVSSYVKKRTRDKALKEMEGMNTNQLQLQVSRYQTLISEHKTSHVLHLIMSLITGGLWLIIWAFVSSSNSTKRSEYQKIIDDIAGKLGSKAA